ncbi:glycosyl transferase, group 1 family protein [Rhodopirellula maiorica SM1]|uniref:Glycosyl transferase, group 1 family protein n=1 Tax=Rhodopirellula maiorica SM1 TaxID=1265738 RepID=M5RBI1_9BACT|nr:glycosyltransferase family 4 protein [Rhodopirellula maiorica]EMI16421.1 glycosyl transferase, group 1 family protein [Rhodopirellula maiorica SM1]
MNCAADLKTEPTESQLPSANVSSQIVDDAVPLCKVAYVMSRFPKLTETFVLFEILAVQQQQVQVEIFPLIGKFSSGKEVAGVGLWRKVREHLKSAAQPAVMHAEAQPCVEKARYMPFFNGAILMANLVMLVRRPLRYLSTVAMIVRDNFGNANYFWGGLSVFPKSVYFAQAMQREGIRHVHAHFANHPAMACFVIHRLTGIPYSFTAHGSDLHRHKHMLRRKVEHAAFVVTISSYNHKVITDHCGSCCAEKVRVIHCGVDVDTFRPSALTSRRDGPLRIICVGTLHEVKGQKYLLQAVSLLREQGINCQVSFVGDGRDLEMLQGLARELSIDPFVTFHGTKTREDLVGLMQSADLLVTPSVPTSDGRREGIPVVLMEAMACGLPVVASRISGIPELVNSDDVGRLCEPKNAEQIAAAIKLFAEDEELRKRVGANARQRIIDDFAIEGNAKQLISLFQSPPLKK